MAPTALDSLTPSLMLHLLSDAKIAIFSQDVDLRYRWIENPPESWETGYVAGKAEVNVLPARAAAQATTIKREVLESGRSQWCDLAVENGRGVRHFEIFITPERDAAGQIVGVVGLAIDVSDRRAHAETLESVAREQAHRTKNLLAVIQGLGTQTARSSNSTEEFIDSFRGRIQSISRSQDLSIDAKRHGARLSHLIETQVHPYLADIGRQLAFTGDDRYLSATGALHVGLAFYELCIAATRSGSLSTPSGRIAVSAVVVDNPDKTGRQCLEVTWRETSDAVGPPIDGFAEVLLQRIVPAAVGGRATMSADDSGRTYRLLIADTEFER